MSEMETRIATALREAADELPETPAPWMELRRRQAERVRARRRTLVGLTSAAVLVPVLSIGAANVLRDRDVPRPAGPAIVDGGETSRETPPGTSSVGPALAAEVLNGGPEALWVYVKRSVNADGKVRDTRCGAFARDQRTPTLADVTGEACSTVSVPSDAPALMRPVPHVLCQSDDPGTIVDCDGTGVVVVAAAPHVTRLTVAAVGGAKVTARQLGRTDQVALFAAEFLDPGVSPGPAHGMASQRFTYTAYDERGAVAGQMTVSGQELDG